VCFVTFVVSQAEWGRKLDTQEDRLIVVETTSKVPQFDSDKFEEDIMKQVEEEVRASEGR